MARLVKTRLDLYSKRADLKLELLTRLGDEQSSASLTKA